MRLRNYFPVALLLCATLLRLYHLDFRALWWDEGLSLFFARLDYQTNARMAVILADTNPPIYRMLLGYWAGFLGWSAFSARLFSALPGIVLVALVYRLARELRFSKAIALIAMALCAASPMLIYYAQEAKGYSLATMAGTGSVLFWLKLHGQRDSGVNGYTTDKRMLGVHPFIRFKSVGTDFFLWFVWGLMLLLAIGSHYITAFLIALENLWTLTLAIRSWRGHESKWIRHWLWQISTQAIVALILLPFVLLTFGGTSAAVRGETGEFSGLSGPLQFFGQHALELTQGPGAGGWWGWGVAVMVIGLLVIGNWRLETGDWKLAVGSWKLLTWILIPILLGFALNVYHEFFFPRFVLYVVPAIMLLVASGLSQIAHRLSRIARFSYLALCIMNCALCIGLWTPTLQVYYPAPGDPAEDWRPIAEAMRPLVREGDAAIYGWGWMPGYLDAYLPPTLPRPHYHLGFFTPESLDPDMASITSGQSRVWLLDYQIDQFDVRNMAGRWLGERSALVYDAWFGKGHIALFGLKPTPTTSSDFITHDFANGLRLTVPKMQSSLAPGEALVLSLIWEPTRPQPERMTIFLHGQAEDGMLVFGRDSEPVNGLSFVTDWKPGGQYPELRGVLVPPDTAPGRYWLTIGMYNTTTGAVDEKGPVTIGALVVEK
jgi:hypothetical protein